MNFMRWIALITIVCFFYQTSHAQTKIYGNVVDHLLNTKIPGAQIRNINSNQTVISDTLGKFQLLAKQGDLISVTSSNYLTDTIYLVNLKYQEVRLVRKENQLDEVIVKGSETNSGAFFSYKPRTPFGGSEVRYQMDAAGNPIGGLKLNLFDSHKDAARRTRNQGFETKTKENEEIRKAFRPEVVKSYLPLKDSDLADFIMMYTPDTKTFFDNKFNMLQYLSNCYKEFLKTSKEQRKLKNDLQ
jgi:hypothetical protein